MAKATITLANGTTAQIEGSASEVKELLEVFSGAHSHRVFQSPAQKRRKKSTSKNATNIEKKPRKEGPMDLIRELIGGGYFKASKRSLPDIQKKLEEQGHIYAQTSLSSPLTRLTRKKELRRIKEKKGWLYVN